MTNSKSETAPLNVIQHFSSTLHFQSNVACFGLVTPFHYTYSYITKLLVSTLSCYLKGGKETNY